MENISIEFIGMDPNKIYQIKNKIKRSKDILVLLEADG